MERQLIFRNDKAISERVVDYTHICERINAAIIAVFCTGVRLDDSQLVKILDADFITEEADRQARLEAQEHSSFAFTGASIDTRQLCAKLDEVATRIAKEVRAVKVRLDYFIFKDGRATLNREKLEQDLTEANSIFAETEEQAEAWRLAQEAKEKLDAYLSFASKHLTAAPFNFSPVVDADVWGKSGLVMLHKDRAELDPKSLCYIK